MDVIAHRGLRSEYPENTLPAILAALEIPKLHGVGFDVEISRDAHPVVLHQETMVLADITENMRTPETKLFSTGGRDASPDKKGQGQYLEPATRNFTTRDWVSALTKDELCAIDAGSWMGKSFRGLQIPTLSEVLALPWGDKTAYLELKDPSFWSLPKKSNAEALALAENIVEAVTPYLASFPHSLRCIAFNPQVLECLQVVFPHIPRILALWTEWRGRASEAIGKAKSMDLYALSLPDILLLEDESWIALAHKEKIAVHAYSVTPARDEPEYFTWTAASQRASWERLAAAGVDALVSDFPSELTAWLNEKKKN